MSISNYDDVIYSRDIIERIEELESQLETEHGEQETALSFEYWLQNENNSSTPDDVEEYNTLKALAEECKQYNSDWKYGETLIRYSYAEDYCQEELEDCGYIPRDLPWWIVINWEETTENWLQDYTEVEFDDVTYYIRSC